MGLTWRDAVSGAAVVAVVVAYAAHMGGVRVALVASTAAASATILLLGAGCAVLVTGDLYTQPQPRWGLIMRRVTCGIGALGAAYGLAGMVADSGYGLRNMVMLIVILWTTAAIWHLVR
jgi:hypothetical protein